MRVFISSTCYDLVDLRAELKEFFDEAGLTPVLSDSLSSEFQVMPDRNSIESCLANVRSCEAFLIVLSNRYGPSLKQAGYNDISATHLEYREAARAGMPIYMYVRDRLEADYALWRRNNKSKDLELLWCKHADDRRLFKLLEEHRKLEKARPTNNWVWLFRDSIELKERLRQDFKSALSHVLVARLFESGRVPIFELRGTVEGANEEFIFFNLEIRNLSGAMAVNPSLLLQCKPNIFPLPSLAKEQTTKRSIQWALPRSINLVLPTRLTSSTLDGHQFLEEGELEIDCVRGVETTSKVTHRFKRRSYVGANLDMRPVPAT